MQNLNDNTAALQAILAAVNALPEAGSGGSGGLPSGISALATGTFTPTQNYTSGADISHGLGVTPNFLVWMIEEDVSATTFPSTATSGFVLNKGHKYSSSSTAVYSIAYYVGGFNASQSYSGTYSRSNSPSYMTDTKCKMYSTSTYAIKTGHTYRWVCGVLEGIL